MTINSETRSLDRASLMVLGLLSVLTVMLYWPALGGPLLLDDKSVIAPLLTAGQRSQSWQLFLFSDSGPLGRPLAMASFILNAIGSLDLRYWKATNLAVHVVNGVLVYRLFAGLAAVSGRSAAAARVLAVGGTGLWLLHPLHISTVMYLSQRMTELATLFALLALVLYVEGRRLGVEGRGARVAIGAAIFVCTPLAAFSKEVGLLTPFYLLALECCVFNGEQWPRPVWLKRLLAACTLLPLLVAAIYFATHWHRSFVGPYSLRDFGPLERLLTEARVVLGYLGWIVAPRSTALGFYHDDVAIATWPPQWASLAAPAVLFTLVAVAWRWRARAPLAAFGVLLFFAGHALESSIFPLELVFEHRNYLPSIGICLVLAAASAHWLEARRATLLLAVLTLLYGLVSASMTPTWGNDGALAVSFVRSHPDSRRARAQLVEWLLGRGDVVNATRVLGQAEDVAAQLHRLRIACVAGESTLKQGAALRAAAALARPDDMSVEILLWLVNQVLDGACGLDSDALVTTLEAIRDRPLSHNSRFLLYMGAAQLRHARGEHERAAQAAAFAAQLVPRDPYPLYLGVEIALDAGDSGAARKLLDAARVRARHQAADFSRMDASLEAQLKAR